MKLGFIGTGNMGSAMIKGIVKAGILEANSIFISDMDVSKKIELHKEIRVNLCKDNLECVENCDYIVLAVKPQYIEEVVRELKDAFSQDKVLISIAVGIPLEFYKNILGEHAKIVRAMPNTPAMVGEGMTLIAFDDSILAQEVEEVKKVLSSLGKVDVLPESLMSEVTALTGSSPAYVFMFIEAMADAAVQSGIPRAMSYKWAAQAVLGSAKMVLETGKHPGELKDAVCSPAGTTIEAVYTLEKNGFRFAVMEAMDNCNKKAREIGRKYNK